MHTKLFFNKEDKTFSNYSTDEDNVALSSTKVIELFQVYDSNSENYESLPIPVDLEESSSEEIWAVAVTYPVTTGALNITYVFVDEEGNETCQASYTYPSRTLEAGNTYRISQEIETEDLYTLKTLTFEDKDAKFTSYEVNGYPISKWSDLIDDPQYGGPLTYDLEGTYFWCDEGNTELSHSFSGEYSGGGHAISNYVVADYENLPDGKYGWYELQFQIPILPKSGSNFCVHNGYSDFFNSQLYDATLVGFSFPEGTERIVDHMYVTNTSYHLNSISYGDGFNTPLADDGYIKIIAYGYDKEDNGTRSTEIYLSNGSSNIAVNWLKFDLTPLGMVNKVVFNFEASEDQSGAYGLNSPAYFAYDDVAVRFPIE